MKITGTLIKNYFHCKRQAYLYYYGLNFHSELTKIGEIMHQKQNPNEFIFEKIKVDDIKDNTLIEFKKTSSNLKGTKSQVLYYLDYFDKKGVKLKGLIKDLTFKDEHIVELNIETKKQLYDIIYQINLLLKGELPQRLKLKKNCKKCSFFDYCWIE